MAVVECPQCYEVNSVSDEKCPSCGCNLNTNGDVNDEIETMGANIAIVVEFAAIVIVILAGIISFAAQRSN